MILVLSPLHVLLFSPNIELSLLLSSSKCPDTLSPDSLSPRWQSHCLDQLVEKKAVFCCFFSLDFIFFFGLLQQSEGVPKDALNIDRPL